MAPLVARDVLRSAGGVAEIQGLYGPFSFPEKLLQKIWLRRDFDRRNLRLVDGRALRILYPGKWNLLGGPDFKDARLQIDGVEVSGDVELHLTAGDWVTHGHASDAAYDRVILHAVLFPVAADHRTIGGTGASIPVIVLLPLLMHDLEEYAAAEAVETLANRPSSRAIEELSAKNASELAALIRAHARQRWCQKIHFAQLRIHRLEWEQACHQTALEILGYRFNRVPMLRIAAQYPLERWASGTIDLQEVWASETDAWSVQGVRPANQPRTRLRQYALWNAGPGRWMERLRKEFTRWREVRPAPTHSIADFRKEGELSKFRARLASVVCGNAVGGTRFDNLVCDGFLPLLAARGFAELEDLWFNWFPGDQPPFVMQSLRALGLADGRNSPACHGSAQGFLGWLIEKETRAAAASSSSFSLGARGLTKFPPGG